MLLNGTVCRILFLNRVVFIQSGIVLSMGKILDGGYVRCYIDHWFDRVPKSREIMTFVCLQKDAK